MVKDYQARKLKKEIADLEEFLEKENVTGLEPYENSLAKEIRKRREMEGRKEAMERSEFMARLIPKIRDAKQKKPASIYKIGGICVLGVLALAYFTGISSSIADFFREKEEQQITPKNQVEAPAEQSDIERVLSQVREQLDSQDIPKRETYRNIIDRPGSITEKYYNAAIVMFSIGNIREGEEQARSYETASAYLEEALRRNPNVDNTGLRGRLNERLEQCRQH